MKKGKKTSPKLWWGVLIFLLFLLVVLFFLFLIVFFSNDPQWMSSRLGVESGGEGKYKALKFLGIGMGGLLVALQALMSYRRATAMEDAANAQADATENQTQANQTAEQGQRQERLKNAIGHLGNASDSVRLGGAYELFHLAEDAEDLGQRQTVLDILCAHTRWTTSTDTYRKNYWSHPSEEIQSLLTLLFVQDHTVFTALRINLEGSCLNGANLMEARLEKAVLTGTCLQEAQLLGADLRGAQLWRTDLRGAVLLEAGLQEARLEDVHLQGVSSQTQSDVSFAGLIRAGIGQETDLSGMISKGGLSQEDVNSLIEDLPDTMADNLRKKLKPHIGEPESTELSPNSCAKTEPYTAEEAERWIAEYKRVLSNAPKVRQAQR